MAGLPVGAQLHPEDPLLADAERVDPAAAHLDEVAASLVDDEVRAHLVRVLLAEPVGAEVAADLLVGGDHEQQLALRGAPAALAEREAGRHLGRDLPLHVQSAAAADPAIDDVAGPGVEGPLVGVRANRVDVAEERERRAVLGAAQTRHQIGALGLRLEQLALEARRGQPLEKDLLAPCPRYRAG